MRRRRFVAAGAGFLVGIAVAFTLPAPQPCHARGILPDPVCTPGVIDGRVTQANIGSTICVAGYTASVRPSSSYTDALKIQQMVAYGFRGSPSDYEEDHLIALEIGGHPTDPHNLWPQLRVLSPGALDKDRFENYLHAQICAGRMTLADAQQRIASDWFGSWTAAGRP